jgi:hypothetical protein
LRGLPRPAGGQDKAHRLLIERKTEFVHDQRVELAALDEAALDLRDEGLGGADALAQLVLCQAAGSAGSRKSPAAQARVFKFIHDGVPMSGVSNQ